MMSRKFTKKEALVLVILGILLVAIVYIVMIQRPAAAILADSTVRKENAEAFITIEETKASRKNQMEETLKQIKEDESIKPLADYDNLSQIVAFLNGVMEKTVEYEINFSEPSIKNFVAQRDISMTFTAKSFESLKDIVKELENCPYYCQVNGLTLLNGAGSDTVSKGKLLAKVTVSFFEYIN